LSERLARESIAYVALGDALGGRPRDPALYCDGVADYEAMAAQPEFRAGLDRVVDGTQRFRLCLMCAEREPLDCHRCLLVGRALAERGLAIGHILHDGSIEPHAQTEERMIKLTNPDADLFATGQAARLAAAYRRRARAVAYRATTDRAAARKKRMKVIRSLIALIVAGATPALAQDIGTLEPKPLPPLAHPDSPAIPAKELFGRKLKPAAMTPSSIGFYAQGCLAGAVALPINGPAWQVMRLSRNRNWGNPSLIGFLERLANKAKKIGWSGLLVGDMSQPRGGPMLTGHASHQVGLDADIWLTPMPHHELSREEREMMSATNMVAEDKLDVDSRVWTHERTKLLRTAAEDAQVERIFVNAAIKKAVCREAGSSRHWLHKLRPWWGHDYHFHVRLDCPPDSLDCKPQPRTTEADGCGHDLDYWFKDSVLHPKPPPVPPKPKPPLTLSSLPPACRQVLLAP
jgi:penicillin-insensitive murein endopeptidase